MKKIQKTLKKFLENSPKTVFLAIGSELRGDDAAGIHAALKLLEKKLPENFKVLLGYTAPENLTGEIKKAAPARLIVCDAAESGLKPGEVSVINPSDVEGAAFSTHTLPMNVFIDYVAKDTSCQTLILGIQPKTLEFGAELTPEVKQSAETLAEIILKTIKN